MIRAFIALPVPRAVGERLAAVQHMLPLATRVPAESFHVSLAFLDTQRDSVLEAVHDGLSAISAPPVRLSVAGIALFGDDAPRLVHAEIAPDPALDRLQAAVTRAAIAAGIPLKRRRFRPHITLSRDRPRGAELNRLVLALAELGGVRFDPFRADEMVLYRSTLHPQGPRYDRLAVYPLATPSESSRGV